MKVVFISDTHNQHKDLKIPSGDILIHCGDATGMGTMAEIQEFNNWLRRQPHKHKFFIPGNHDKLFEKDPKFAKSLITGAKVLVDKLVEVEGLKIYGSPYQPTFGVGWVFNLDRGEAIAKKWAQIPSGIDILVTHGPPHNILDKVVQVYTQDPGMGRMSGRVIQRVAYVGCEELIKVVEKIKPRVHAFGHIHYSYGMDKKLWDDGKETVFINASICTEQYKPLNVPIVIDIDPD